MTMVTPGTVTSHWGLWCVTVDGAQDAGTLRQPLIRLWGLHCIFFFFLPFPGCSVIQRVCSQKNVFKSWSPESTGMKEVLITAGTNCWDSVTGAETSAIIGLLHFISFLSLRGNTGDLAPLDLHMLEFALRAPFLQKAFARFLMFRHKGGLLFL